LISDETDRSVRSHLARLRDSNGDLSQFVDRAVRQAVFWETLDTVWKDDERLSPEQAQDLADDAVAESRAARP
jgi:hypothetical protein